MELILKMDRIHVLLRITTPITINLILLFDSGDPGKNGQVTSNNIKIVNNMVIKPRKKAATGGILIKIGSGHLVQGNTIEEGGLLLTGGISINSNLEFNKNKFIDNTFCWKKQLIN